jgi:hypothetical protein
VQPRVAGVKVQLSERHALDHKPVCRIQVRTPFEGVKGLDLDLELGDLPARGDAKNLADSGAGLYPRRTCGGFNGGIRR